MPGTVVGKTLNFGYPGQISRQGDEISRTRPVKKGAANIPFGAAVEIGAVVAEQRAIQDRGDIGEGVVAAHGGWQVERNGELTGPGEPVGRGGGISSAC